jgi:hypothetical protein
VRTPPPIGLLLTLLWGCPAPPSGNLITPTPEPTPVEEDDDDAIDDDDIIDDDDSAAVPPEFPVPVFDPPGGGFVGSVEVRVTSSTGEGDVFLCASDPTQSCLLVEGGDVLLPTSKVVRARVDFRGVQGIVQARSYFAVEESLVDFTSNLPLFIAWTDASGIERNSNTPIALDVLDGRPDRTGILDVPVDSGRARMHIRGSSSAGLAKKAYDLELWQGTGEEDRRVGLLGLPEDGDWVLYAPYHWDDALVRNALGYGLSNEIGRYAPRTRFFEMFLATRGEAVGYDDYIGVYSLTEEIERGSDRIAIERLLSTDVVAPEITGGYVFKRDRRGSGDASITAGTAGGTYSFGTPIVPVDPETAQLQAEQIDYLEDALDDMANALAAADGIDARTGLHYSELLDVDSFIDHNILNLIVKNPDAFRLSGYFFKDREGPIHAGPIWDLDRTAASRDSRARHPTWWDAKNQTNDCTPIFTYGWYAGLFSREEFNDSYWAQFSWLLENELSVQNMMSMLDFFEFELAEAAPRNTARWDRPDWDQEMAKLRTWLTDRHTWIVACIANHEDPRDCQGD